MPSTIEKIYNDHIRTLSTAEKIELREQLDRELENDEEGEVLTRNRSWSEIIGTMPNLLKGEDATYRLERE